jgi:hypothetical protein
LAQREAGATDCRGVARKNRQIKATNVKSLADRGPYKSQAPFDCGINAVVEFGHRYAVTPIFRSQAQPPARRQGRTAPSCESFEGDPAVSGFCCHRRLETSWEVK